MIKDFIKKHWKLYLSGIAFLIGIDYLQILVPKLVGRTINLLDEIPRNVHLIDGYALEILAVAVGVMVGRFVWRRTIIGGSRKFERHAQQSLFEKLLSLPMIFFDSNSAGNLMAYFNNDIAAVRMALSQGVIMITDAVAMTFFVFLGMLTTVDYKLVLISLVPLPFVALSSWHFGGKIHTRFKNVQKDFSTISQRAQEIFSNVKAIKSYGVEKNFEKLFSGDCDTFVTDNYSLLKVSAVFGPIVNFLAALTTSIAVFYGGQMVVAGTVNLGDFIAFITYLGMLTWPFIAIGQVVNILQRGKASYERLESIMHEKERKEDGIEFPGDFERLEVKNLDFSYGDLPTLKGINLSIRTGEKVAIVGRTGCGKSTLAKLLVRLYEVDEGRIFYNKTDIKKMDARSLREAVLLIPQDSFLFSNTISRNVAFGIKDFGFEGVENASRIAHFHEEVVKFDKKYDTFVGERGVTLSGGQRQRLALSRGIFKGAKMIILDDIMSAVDSETATMILDDLSKNLEAMTVIVITHNLASVKNSDRIFVMDEGEIVESGDHDTLMERKGLYQRLFMIQQLEREIGA